MKKLLLLTLGVLIALPSLAKDENGDFTYTYEGQTITYTVIDEEAKTCRTKMRDYYGAAGNPDVYGSLILPAHPMDDDVEYTLTEIGNYAFCDCHPLISVEIPNSVTLIGERAFLSCDGLTSVEIPNSVTSIADQAFAGCTGLISVEIPNSVTSIGLQAFSNCNGLTSVVIPSSVTSIGEDPFWGCSGMIKSAYPSTISNPFLGSSGVSVQYPAEGAEIENGVVYGVGKTAIYFAPLTLTGEFKIPNTVTTIGARTFQYCSGLTSIDIPNSVKEIGDEAFNSCTGLTSIDIPSSVTYIGYEAFGDCTGLEKAQFASIESLCNIEFNDGGGGQSNPLARAHHLYIDGKEITDVIVPDGITKLSVTFNGGSFLKSIKIPNSVTKIGNYTFGRCDELSSIAIPGSVTEINYLIFWDCAKLSSIVFESSPEILHFNESGPMFADLTDFELFLGRNYYKTSTWSTGSAPFLATSSVEKLTFGEYVTEIPSGEFYDCKQLKSIEMQNGMIKIGNSAFEGCSSLESVLIPPSVTTIGQQAFAGCDGLKKCAYPSTFQRKPPFSSGFAVVYYPYSASVEDGFLYAYEKSQLLFAPISIKGDFVIPETVQMIGEGAFAYCDQMTSVSIPETVNRIGMNAFAECTPLEKTQFASLARLCTTWFGSPDANPLYFTHKLVFDDEEITDLVISDNIGFIYNYAFAGCTDIKSVKILTEWVPGISEETFEASVYADATLDIPTGTLINYLASNWSLFNTITVGGHETRLYSDGTLSYRLVDDPAAREAIIVAGDYGELTALSVPGSVTDENGNVYKVTAIGPNAFANCDKLASVDFSNNSDLTTIAQYAFAGCTALTKAEFASIDALCHINFFTFESNPLYFAHHLYVGGAEVKELVIPESVTVVNNYAFAGCERLTSVKIPSTVTTIGARAFYGCVRLASVDIPESVTAIGYETFADCSRLTSIKIPGSVDYINSWTFKGCNLLASVEIGNGVKAIWSEAFAGCSSLESIEIPASVSQISYGVFSNCTALKSFKLCDGEEPIYLSEMFESVQLEELYLGRPTENTSVFPRQTITKLTIGNTVTEINQMAFMGWRQLSSLTLGSSLVTIGDEAFADCNSLTEVILPPSVETIGERAFSNTSNLENIVMGHNVKTIGSYAFYGSPAKNVTITAQTPPVAPNDAFSSYTGKLWLQDPGDNSVKDAYYDADDCWYRFAAYAMINAERIDGETTEIKGKPGETFQLTAKIWPENATLPQIFWRSTNPAVATVDENGLVTIVIDFSEVISRSGDGEERECKIIAETLYADGPLLEVSVFDTSAGINDIIADTPADTDTIDYDAPYEVYNLNGAKVADSIENLRRGFYIVRQGRVAKKIAL